MSVIVLCPSRGRSAAAWEALYSLEATRGLPDTRIVFVIDRDDPLRAEYQADRVGQRLSLFFPVHQHPRGMVGALNEAAVSFANDSDATVLGFIGDDHRFRTPGWDEIFAKRLDDIGGGFAYGHDGAWTNGEIATQIFISVEIVRALGWMALPSLHHLYVDNAWVAMGEALERLLWFPNYLIEHMHPAFSKAQWDDSYRLNNSTERYAHDREAFEYWRQSRYFQEDVERVRRALADTAAQPAAG